MQDKDLVLAPAVVVAAEDGENICVHKSLSHIGTLFES